MVERLRLPLWKGSIFRCELSNFRSVFVYVRKWFVDQEAFLGWLTDWCHGSFTECDPHKPCESPLAPVFFFMYAKRVLVQQLDGQCRRFMRFSEQKTGKVLKLLVWASGRRDNLSIVIYLLPNAFLLIPTAFQEARRVAPYRWGFQYLEWCISRVTSPLELTFCDY